MKLITTLLFSGVVAMIGGTAKASPSDLDLGFRLIHSSEFDVYSKSNEAKGLSLMGMEWNGEGGDQKGDLIEYKLKFLKIEIDKSGKAHNSICDHGVTVYFTSNVSGTRTFTGADFSNYDLKCQ